MFDFKPTNVVACNGALKPIHLYNDDGKAAEQEHKVLAHITLWIQTFIKKRGDSEKIVEKEKLSIDARDPSSKARRFVEYETF